MKPIAHGYIPGGLYPRPEAGEGVSLYDVAAILWRRRWLFAAILLLATAGSLLMASLLPERYASEATLKIGRVLTDGGFLANVSEVAVELETRFGESAVVGDGPVLERIEVPKQERKSMDAFLKLRVVAGTAEQAQAHLAAILAEVVTADDEYFAARLAQIRQRKARLVEESTAARRQIAEIETILKSLGDDALAQAPILLVERSNLLQRLQQAETKLPELEFAEKWSRATEVVGGPSLSERRVSPRKAMILAFGILAGLLAGMTLVFGFEFLANFRHRLLVQEPVS
jgi:uncharacterized protein involved in exopolysaccharide biosynthesis